MKKKILLSHQMRQSPGKRGTSIVELILALAIGSIVMTSVITLIFANEYFLQWQETHEEVINITNEMQAKIHYQALYDFSSLTSSTTIRDSVQIVLNVDDTTTFSKKVTLTVTSVAYPLITFSSVITVYDVNNSKGKQPCLVDTSLDVVRGEIISGPMLDSSVVATDVVVIKGYAYITADSSTQNKEDFFIVDIRNPRSPVLISKINTGPGLKAVVVDGQYAYVANTSINAQLEIININNPQNPTVIASQKIPFASTTKGVGRSIAFQNNTVYLGTTKADGPEFHIIDVSNPYVPRYVNGFEIDAVVNEIRVMNTFAYLATPNYEQLRIIDVGDPDAMREVGHFRASGYETQEGESVEMYDDAVYFGRSVGGFNNPRNHELFSLTSSTTPQLKMSVDVAASVNGIVVQTPFIFIATNDATHEFQIRDKENGSLIDFIDLPSTAVALRCYKNMLVVALASNDALRILLPQPLP